MRQISGCLNKGTAGLGHFRAVHRDKTVHVDGTRCSEIRAAQHAGPEQAVEIDDVFTDEVIDLSLAIFFPVVLKVHSGVVAMGFEAGQIANRRIQPDIKVLARCIWNLEAKVGRITADIPWHQPRIQPLSQFVRHLRLQASRSRPIFEKVLELRQIKEQMLAVFEYGDRPRQGRNRILQLVGFISGAAALAVIPVLV